MIYNRRLQAVAALVAVALLLTGVYALLLRKPALRITAHFPEAVGLYAGNNVDILGVPVGQITSITPRGSEVIVEMSVPSDTHIPANAQAVILSPNPVSDRFIQLTPAYSSGDLMRDGADIPLARTATPVEVDQITNTLDQLATALGPNGANAKGTLADLLHVAAQTLDGNGKALHDTVDGLARALPALTSNGPQVAQLLTNLDTLTKALADHDATVAAFLRDLAAASELLASERQDLAAALSSLQSALSQLTAFVQTNRAALAGDLSNLASATTGILSQQQALLETLDTVPLALGNFAGAVDPTSGLLNARVILTPGNGDVINQVCGDPTPRILRAAVANGKGPLIDVACPLLEALIQEPAAPGAPNDPNMQFQQFLGGSP